MQLAIVLTTIQEPTPSVHALAARARALGAPLVVIGDRKGPARFDLAGSEFLPIDRQRDLPFALARLLPEKHYARKNLGYLVALQRGAQCLYETDDDNAPLAEWTLRSPQPLAVPLAPAPWLNVYRWFTGEHIWPRGLPLRRLLDPDTLPRALTPAAAPEPVAAPVQQGLVNGSPDVDAVWRLVLDRPFAFDGRPSVLVPPGSFCPFNSQSTWWWPEAYPLLYLPSYCSFRMTDIWRSFVAQRCLHALGRGVVFHAAEALQERNAHDYLRDFQDEVPGYLENERLVQLLRDLPLEAGADAAGRNLLACYRALVGAALVPERELPLVEAWCDDVARTQAAG